MRDGEAVVRGGEQHLEGKASFVCRSLSLASLVDLPSESFAI